MTAKASTPKRVRRAPTLPSPEAGERLKREIHVARARTAITSDSQLAVQAGVHYDTFMNWFGGRTTPRPFEVRKVAEVLGVSYGDLIAAYEGKDPPQVPLEQAVADLIVEIRTALVDERQARAELMRAIAASMAVAMGPATEPAELERVGGGNGR